MKAAGAAKSQYAQTSPDRGFRATASMVLDMHRDDNGFCLGCYVYFRQLKPFPCEYHSWAARVIATYPAPTPAAGRPPAQDRRSEGARPVPALRLVPPSTSSASDDTVVIRSE
ncbi:hypothetical protein J5U46_08600 [Micromonospora tulbaghiae]|uniref:Uncharacterized protein n=1 Tax=Micromonospora tulbaghiae TaxID=479978 RepID=A0AAW4JG02_9ACTN|nr:hypothetical protein [Micromonospora tulbaghiae]MBO4140200.1 hypothetical protein [Micromonospora tulbaghiae]